MDDVYKESVTKRTLCCWEQREALHDSRSPFGYGQDETGAKEPPGKND